jgi:hypothetical protein
MKKALIAIIIIVVTAIACSKDPAKEIVGIWDTGEGVYLLFNENGKIKFSHGMVEGKWEIENGQIKVAIGTGGYGRKPQRFDAVIDNEKMTFKDAKTHKEQQHFSKITEKELKKRGTIQ